MSKNQLKNDVQSRWDTNATFWDGKMGEGNQFHRILIEPATLRLLDLKPNERVLEIACGNGQFARKMTSLGAQVLATDFSPAMIERARAHREPFNDRVDYRVLDATDADALNALSTHAFDAVISNMAIMDMAEIDPLFRAFPHLLKPQGRFVFTTQHPCFNNSGMRLTVEEEDRSGEIIETRALKLTWYLTPSTDVGIGIFGQPVPHYYFHRPLHVLFGAAFAAGLVMDGMEEPRFPHTHDNKRWAAWENYSEFPPVLAARLRVAGS